MVTSKDPQVQDRQLDQKSLSLSADLATGAGSSEAAAIIAISGALATRTVVIDVKEAVKSAQKVQVINKATGQSAALLSAPVISGNTITFTIDGTALASACIEVSYRN